MNRKRHTRTLIAVAVPNALSAARLLCAALFPLCSVPWRVALVLIAAISDGLDGLAARLTGHMTWWGGMIDSASDKVFAATVIIDLIARGHLALWQALLLLTRDMTVVVIVASLAATGRWSKLKQAQAAWLGKVTTAVMFVLFVLLVIWPADTPGVFALVLVCMALSAAAAVDYVVRLLRGRRREVAEADDVATPDSDPM